LWNNRTPATEIKANPEAIKYGGLVEVVGVDEADAVTAPSKLDRTNVVGDELSDADKDDSLIAAKTCGVILGDGEIEGEGLGVGVGVILGIVGGTGVGVGVGVGEGVGEGVGVAGGL
jgi:hypothetical protein